MRVPIFGPMRGNLPPRSRRTYINDFLVTHASDFACTGSSWKRDFQC